MSRQSEWPPSKNLQTINAGEDVTKRKPSYTVGGNANWYSHCAEQCGDSLKTQGQRYHKVQYLHCGPLPGKNCNLEMFTQHYLQYTDTEKTYCTSTDAWIRNFVHLYKTRKHLVSLVTRPCLSLCDTVDRSMPGFPVHHQFLELAQTHVYQDGDATEPSHPLSSPSPPVFNLAQHQGLFQ